MSPAAPPQRSGLRSPRLVVPGVVAVLALAVAAGGCETTAQKSARLARGARTRLRAEKGLQVTASNSDVRVVSTAVVSDANGTAAAVTLRNASPHPLADVPVAIDVLDGRGSTLFQNNAPGLEPSLTGVPLIAGHATFTWVNDQITASGRPARVTARVGQAPAGPAAPPQIAVIGVTLFDDPSSGLAARGTVVDRSTVAQQKLVVFAVARRAGRVVAAGRAIVPALAPSKPTPFTVYFIGNPRGATLEMSAPPTTLR